MDDNQDGRLSTLAPRASGTVLWLATVAMGLMAGLFWGFAVSVMPALGRVDDRTFVDTMQTINRAIENGMFVSVFFGALVLTAAATVLAYLPERTAAARWALAALVCYVLALGITMVVNVPLNDELDAAGAPARIADPTAVRAAFEEPWNLAHNARSAACVIALACLGRALWVYRTMTTRPRVRASAKSRSATAASSNG